MLKNLKVLCISVLYAGQLFALEPFLVKDLRFDGLQRVSEGTVYNYLPFKAGDYLDTPHSTGIIRTLFKTGFFETVELAREGETLVIHFKERPAIAKIKIQGNETIKTEELLSSLKQIGLAEGRTYDPSVVERITRDLERQFMDAGKYALEVETKISPLERNRVDIEITMKEGETARIQEIILIGNKDFSEKKIRSLMTLSTPWLFSWFTKDDQYSKSKLGNDLETIRNYYLDRGYLNVTLNSTQVSLSQDKASIYITINLTEGARYKISAVELAGNWIVPETEISSLLNVKVGSYFSRADLSSSIQALTERLGKEGYAFARIDPIPKIDEATKTTILTFNCDPGRRFYARKINFTGNHRTKDQVLRREMTQLEASPLSTAAIEDSRTRLNRTGFFGTVEIDTKPVEDKVDEVDLAVAVTEAESGQISGSVGYSTEDGILYGINVSNRNFLGSGNSAGFNFNHSKAATSYNVSYDNPYYTPEGISRGFNVFYSKTDLSKTANIADFTTDAYGGTLRYSFPITALSKISAGYGYQATLLKISNISIASTQLQDFTAFKAEKHYEEVIAFGGWSYNALDRFIFPEKGRAANIDLGATVAGSLHYYRMNAKHQWYHPLGQGFVFIHQIETAYGDGYGNTHGLPFYKHFYAGGSSSVRGFQENSLGPRDSQGKSYGGNLLLTTSVNLAVPNFISEGTSSTRTTLFVDAGQVWDTKPARGVSGANGLRFSAGVSLTWMSPLGPLVFNLAKPLKKFQSSYRDSTGKIESVKDRTETFSFAIGSSF